MITQIAVKEEVMQLTVADSPKSWWQRRTRLEQRFLCGMLFLLAVCLGMAISLPWISLARSTATLPNTSGAKALSSQNSPCGNWTPYKNEECIVYVEHSGQQTKEASDAICKNLVDSENPENVPRVVNVKTNEKQIFLHKFLFDEHATFDNIWLGLELGNDSVFRWNDGTDLFFTNWAEQETATNADRRCVQMKSGEGSYKTGEWLRSNCKKRNAVVCEKTQTWSATRLEDILLSLKLEVERNKKDAEEKIKTTKEAADKELEKKIMATNQAAEGKIMAAMKYTEATISAVMNETEEQILAAMLDAETKISAVQSIMEKMINVTIQEAEQNINAVKLDAETKIANNKKEVEQTIITMQRETEQRINEARFETEQKINESAKGSVPVGFIYVQLPNQAPPTSIWPQLTWIDVSTLYAGLFFRVVGGKAADFGQVQQESSPRLSNVEWSKAASAYQSSQKMFTIPANGSWSSFVLSGDQAAYSYNTFLRFKVSQDEVRPQNKAVCIWKRVA